MKRSISTAFPTIASTAAVSAAGASKSPRTLSDPAPAVFSFGWSLFLLSKSALEDDTDLLSLFKLLVCVLHFLIIHAPSSIRLASFNEPPYDLDDSEAPPKKRRKSERRAPKQIDVLEAVSALCDSNIKSSEVHEVYTTTFTPFVERVLNSGPFKTNSLDLAPDNVVMHSRFFGALLGKNLLHNLSALSKEYEVLLHDSGGLDERSFLKESGAEVVGTPSKISNRTRRYYNHASVSRNLATDFAASQAKQALKREGGGAVNSVARSDGRAAATTTATATSASASRSSTAPSQASTTAHGTDGVPSIGQTEPTSPEPSTPVKREPYSTVLLSPAKRAEPATPISSTLAASMWLKNLVDDLPEDPPQELLDALEAVPQAGTVFQETVSLLPRVLFSTKAAAAASQPNSEPDVGTTSDSRRTQAKKLFFVSLQAILSAAGSKSPASANMLASRQFHLSLLALSCEVVLYSYKVAPMAFPYILQVLSLTPWDLFKVVESFLRQHATMPRVLKMHLSHVEEQILHELIWNQSSPIWSLLDDKSTSTPAASSDVPQRPPQSTFASVFASLAHEAVGNRPQGQAVLKLVFHKTLHLAYKRLHDLCGRLQWKSNLLQMAWTTINRVLAHERYLLKGRHLDQIIICAIYGVARLRQVDDLKFKDIFSAYRTQPQFSSSVYRNVLLTRDPNTGEEIYDNIIKFYNTVFVNNMRGFLVGLGPRTSPSRAPNPRPMLSPLPVRKGPWSPTKAAPNFYLRSPTKVTEKLLRSEKFLSSTQSLMRSPLRMHGSRALEDEHHHNQPHNPQQHHQQQGVSMTIGAPGAGSIQASGAISGVNAVNNLLMTPRTSSLVSVESPVAIATVQPRPPVRARRLVPAGGAPRVPEGPTGPSDALRRRLAHLSSAAAALSSATITTANHAPGDAGDATSAGNAAQSSPAGRGDGHVENGS